MGGRGGTVGVRTRGRGGSGGVGRKIQTGDQGLSVIICSKYIDKLDGSTMRCMEELCETLMKISDQLATLGGSLTSERGHWAFSEKFHKPHLALIRVQ